MGWPYPHNKCHQCHIFRYSKLCRECKVELWHDDSPGIRVTIRPCFLRRIGLIRSDFATTGEICRMYREAGWKDG